MDEAKLKILIHFQKYEMTEHIIYKMLADRIKGKNSQILQNISEDELSHYTILKKYSKKEIKPDRWMIFKFSLLSRILGITFAIKLMEKGEEKAKVNYKILSDDIPEIKKIIFDEEEHEKLLINSIDEKMVKHIGSIVLGLNDAIVELTGALVGFSFAIKNPLNIGLIGVITGVSAALSMAGSEYLSAKTEGNPNPLAASLYTGATYMTVVILLTLPFFLFSYYLHALSVTLLTVIFITVIFNIFVSVVREVSFKKSLTEMLIISGGVSIISFIIGTLVRNYFGIEV